MLITQELLKDQSRLTEDFYSDCGPSQRASSQKIANIPISQAISEKQIHTDDSSPKNQIDERRAFLEMQEERPEGPTFRPGQMIDLWKNLQDLLRNQFKEEC